MSKSPQRNGSSAGQKRRRKSDMSSQQSAELDRLAVNTTHMLLVKLEGSVSSKQSLASGTVTFGEGSIREFVSLCLLTVRWCCCLNSFDEFIILWATNQMMRISQSSKGACVSLEEEYLDDHRSTE
mmetsp:Transcript_3395/g.6383  ORF Transcript_3395/g.6383 Transcript_3395/m.6383 type:complete len:126 (+) Transcript_3395:774-1151(+)